MKNIFDASITDEVINRIHKLTPESKPLWGKMSVSKMLAHCSVTYEMIYEDKHPKPGFLMKFILKQFVKKKVTNEVPFGKSLQTAPQFIIKDDKNFLEEKNWLIGYILKTQRLGENYFDGKESDSFGKLTKTEWNNMFYKHLDHHLSQFNV